MSAEDLEKYETEMELQLYREYRDVVGLFTHVVETERRFYLTNQVELNVRTGRRRGLLRGDHAGRLGVGHVPPGPVREERPGCHLQGRQHRGARQERPRAPRRRVPAATWPTAACIAATRRPGAGASRLVLHAPVRGLPHLKHAVPTYPAAMIQPSAGAGRAAVHSPPAAPRRLRVPSGSSDAGGGADACQGCARPAGRAASRGATCSRGRAGGTRPQLAVRQGEIDIVAADRPARWSSAR